MDISVVVATIVTDAKEVATVVVGGGGVRVIGMNGYSLAAAPLTITVSMVATITVPQPIADVLTAIRMDKRGAREIIAMCATPPTIAMVLQGMRVPAPIIIIVSMVVTKVERLPIVGVLMAILLDKRGVRGIIAMFVTPPTIATVLQDWQAAVLITTTVSMGATTVERRPIVNVLEDILPVLRHGVLEITDIPVLTQTIAMVLPPTHLLIPITIIVSMVATTVEQRPTVNVLEDILPVLRHGVLEITDTPVLIQLIAMVLQGWLLRMPTIITANTVVIRTEARPIVDVPMDMPMVRTGVAGTTAIPVL